MNSETLNTFARCRSLALAAMISAGGRPCWVAAYAPDGSPAAGSASAPPARAPKAGPAPPAAGSASAPAPSPREVDLLGATFGAAQAARMAAVLDRLPVVDAAYSRRRH